MPNEDEENRLDKDDDDDDNDDDDDELENSLGSGVVMNLVAISITVVWLDDGTRRISNLLRFGQAVIMKS